MSFRLFDNVFNNPLELDDESDEDDKAEANDEDARFRKSGSLLFLENFRSFDFDECFFSGGGDKRVVGFHSPCFAAF